MAENQTPENEQFIEEQKPESSATPINLDDPAVKELIDKQVAQRVVGLVGNKDKILEEKKSLQEKLRAYEAAEAERQRKEMEAKGEYEKILQQEREQAQQEREALQAKLVREQQHACERELARHIAEAVSKSGTKYSKLLATEMRSQLRAVRQDDGRIEVLVHDDDGKPVYNAKAQRYMTTDDLLDAMRDDAQYAVLFPASGVSGGGTTASAGGAGGQLKSRMTREQRADFIAKHGEDAYFALTE